MDSYLIGYHSSCARVISLEDAKAASMASARVTSELKWDNSKDID